MIPTQNVLSQKPYHRWEEAKKTKRREINYKIFVTIISLPATVIAIGGSCAIWKYGIDDPEENPLTALASFVSSLALPLIPALIGLAAELNRRELNKNFLWTIEDVISFENTLREKTLKTIDWQIMDAAAKSGVISYENYKKWWVLLENNIQLIQKKDRSFNLEDHSTTLLNEVQEHQKNYKLENDQLHADWNKLKENMLTDLPIENNELPI